MPFCTRISCVSYNGNSCVQGEAVRAGSWGLFRFISRAGFGYFLHYIQPKMTRQDQPRPILSLFYQKGENRHLCAFHSGEVNSTNLRKFFKKFRIILSHILSNVFIVQQHFQVFLYGSECEHINAITVLNRT